MRFNWEPYPNLNRGLIARRGEVIANIWFQDAMPVSGEQWVWSVYVNLREKGWLRRHGHSPDRQAASDAANDAVPEVEAELARRRAAGTA